MITAGQRYQHIWNRVQDAVRSKRKVIQGLKEELSFFVYRTDNNAVLAKGIRGFDAAKEAANRLRKSQGLKWDQVKFKAERKTQQPSGQFGVSADGRTFTNARGEHGRMDYARTVNPSKGRRFSGYYDKHGNFHDLD